MNYKSRFKILVIVLGILLPSVAGADPRSNYHTPKVEVLVASWCVHCRDVEKFLRDQQIPYTALDIEKDESGRKRYQELGGGGVPMLIIGDSVLRGFDREAILELLSRPKSIVGQTFS